MNTVSRLRRSELVVPPACWIPRPAARGRPRRRRTPPAPRAVGRSAPKRRRRSGARPPGAGWRETPRRRGAPPWRTDRRLGRRPPRRDLLFNIAQTERKIGHLEQAIIAYKAFIAEKKSRHCGRGGQAAPRAVRGGAGPRRDARRRFAKATRRLSCHDPVTHASARKRPALDGGRASRARAASARCRLASARSLATSSACRWARPTRPRSPIGDCWLFLWKAQ